jgi:hypothetical protein
MESFPKSEAIPGRIIHSISEGLRRGLRAFLKLSTIMIPVYLVVAILKLTPLFDILSRFFEPFMTYFGLPGNSALAYVTGTFVNLYAALAIVAGIDITGRQVTILAIMMGISHSQIMESAILAKMKARPIIISTARVIVSLACGLALNLVLPV